jgi:hypothetical protein
MEDGTYQFGELGPFKVAQLRGRLMVRLTNSWDTLEHVLLSTKPKVGLRKPHPISTLILSVLEQANDASS